MRTAWAVSLGSTLAALGVSVVAVVPAHRGDQAPAFPEPRAESALRFESDAQAEVVRAAALAAADVWPGADAADADLGTNPPDPGGLLSGATVQCRFLSNPVDGTTPKFRCVLDNGDVVRVKYGATAEIPAEIAATRLLAALGFGADRVYVVPHLRCYGCPRVTFRSMWLADRLGAREMLAGALPHDRYTDFHWVAVERRFPGTEFSTADREGWGWFELPGDQAPPEQKAELDAFRLVARFLAHWDNKSANQRLVCRPGEAEPSTCDAPIAFMQDLGATFGPRKMDLDGWERTPVWQDRTTCRVTMRDLPYGGGTFRDVQISEGGRTLLARQLIALRDEQIAALFRGARVAEFHGTGRSADVNEWARVFNAKVQAIASGPACPSS
jgi:hypothetical protein